MSSFAIWRMVCAFLLIVPLSCLSLFAICRVPWIGFWKLSVGLIEWGYVAVLLLFVGACLVDRNALWGRVCLGMVVVGTGCLFSPIFRAIDLRDMVAKKVTSIVGNRSVIEGKSHAQDEPFRVGGLLGTHFPQVETTRHMVQVGDGKSLPLLFVRQVEEGQAKKPLVVMLHGGSWQSGGPEQLSNVNEYIATLGVHVASITYRLSPAHQFPTHLRDIQTILKWLRGQGEAWQIDVEQIVLMGRSAGAHLALLAGMKPVVPGIRAIVGLYGPTDMHWSWNHPSSPWILDSPRLLREFLGGSPDEVPKSFDRASPILQISKTTVPIMLVHGSRDELVSSIQSRRLASALELLGRKVLLLELPWATHGCDVNLHGPSGQMIRYALERFLGSVLLGSAKRK